MRLTGADLGCVRAGRNVFSGLSFSVESGTALLVTGPNGSGKASLRRMIAGLIRIAAGELALDPADADRSLAEQVHYLGHLDALKPALSLLENLQFWAAYLGDGGAGMAPSAALEAVGLGEIVDLPAGYLSAGPRRPPS